MSSFIGTEFFYVHDRRTIEYWMRKKHLVMGSWYLVVNRFDDYAIARLEIVKTYA